MVSNPMWKPLKEGMNYTPVDPLSVHLHSATMPATDQTKRSGTFQAVRTYKLQFSIEYLWNSCRSSHGGQGG